MADHLLAVRQIGHVLENRCCSSAGTSPGAAPQTGIFNGLIDSTGIEQKMDLLGLGA